MTLGIQNAGFQTVFATDCMPASAATFSKNYPEVPFFLGEIELLTRERLEQALDGHRVDLVVGGPPCQGFSTLGDQNPADPRNGLFWHFVKVVGWLQPSCFIMENVNYLRTQYGGRYEREICNAFESLGYHTDVRTLNSADFGVPQIRKRVFFVGTKLGEEFEWPVETHGDGRQPYVGVGAVLEGIADDAPNHRHLKHSDKVIARYKLIPEGGRMPPPSELPPEIRRKNFGNTYKRLHRSRPSLTLVPGNNAFPIHPVEDRSLSPREAARIQGFPDTYLLAGSRAEQCKLVGNAVPVLVAQRLGEAVRSHILAEPPANQTSNQKAAHVDEANQPMKIRPRPVKLNAVSLFTGVGGLMLGFLNAGVTVRASFDLKKSVARNAEINFPDVPHQIADVATLTPEDVCTAVGPHPIDIVFGGPPCQGFSIFGRRRFVNTKDHKPDQDERNEVSIKFIELAIALAPKAIFMENVKGFLSTQRGESDYLSEVEIRLREAGYEFEHRVVNCASYGVPQSRERFILVAWRAGLKFLWPEPKHFAQPKAWQRRFTTVGDVITDLMDSTRHDEFFSHVPMNHKELVVERYKLIPEGGRLPEQSLPETLKKGYRSDNVKNYSHVYKRLSMSAPATTMVPGHNAFPVHPVLHRTLTVREAARIQTFPDWMRFVGTRQQQCTLVGNAVPPLLAEIFATSMVKALKGNFSSESYKRDVYDLATAS